MPHIALLLRTLQPGHAFRSVQVVNIMKGAILTAGSIVTVSESYAWEITRPAHGVGLHTILAQRSGDLIGIVNGMDVSTWNPSDDPHLLRPYSVSSLSGKVACKRELRRMLGLPEAEYGVDVPLLAFIGRLDPQKGSDIILSALSGLLSLDCQVHLLIPCPWLHQPVSTPWCLITDLARHMLSFAALFSVHT